MRCGIKTAKSLAERHSSPSSSLWIGDELLLTTYHRFVKPYDISHKRHHGHIPGPLEFRKRQAKRRMASLTFSDASNTSLPSLWPALFHLGSLFRTPPSLDTQWTWEAPKTSDPPLRSDQMEGAAKDFDSSDAIDQLLHWDVEENETTPEAEVLSRSKDYEGVLSQLYSFEGIRALYWETCPTGTDARSFSQSAFKRVLELATKTRRNRLGIVIEFLESDMNIPSVDAEVGNVRLFLEWVKQHLPKPLSQPRLVRYLSKYIAEGQPSSAELCYLLRQYRHLIATKLEPEEISWVVKTLCESVQGWLIAHGDSQPCNRVATLLVDIVRGLPMDWTNTVTFANTIARFPTRYRQKHTAAICDHIVELIRLNINKSNDDQVVRALQEVMLLSFYDTEADAADFRNWWLRVLVKITRNLVKSSRSEAHEGKMLARWISMLDLRAIYQDNDMYQDLWNCLSSVLSSSEGRDAVQSYISQPDHIFFDPPKNVSIFESLIKSPGLMPKVDTAQIHDCLARGDVQQALKFFATNKSIKLSSCESLLFSMVSDGCASHRTIMRVLGRNESHNNVKLRGRTHPHNPLSPRRVRLVENLAYHISISDKPTHRQAFRMVLALHQYLRGNHAGLSPTMSRAILRAGATRFLRDRQVVPRERFAWILGIVGKAEGQDVANHLDTVAGRWLNAVWDEKELKRIQGHAVRHKKPQLTRRSRGGSPWHMSKGRSRKTGLSHNTGSMFRLRGVASPYIVSEEWIRPMRKCEDEDVIRDALDEGGEHSSGDGLS
ncbi:hypothetical protein K461DRAFT_281158 [Myriangium duriaei CBS 260.36]|uniref:Uncharacterized protein n=1 Tax=Myriangium duriaei CBS 260.36 TaxID=1168546 RepID=A0A9P4ME82_9PEZI|nr:hypothetical protein K461DRAFT_281158 [Myriangium duriaei CBS 260.36]